MEKARGLKIAIAGKGGVGKTTIASGLARLFSAEGRLVVAVDADPDANLGGALGATSEQLASITPLSKMAELIEERAGSPGGFFRLNPKVDDLPEKLSVDLDGVRLLVLGQVESGGAGCICPESAMLKALVRHLVIERRDVVILDMEAGVEHLGRGTASFVDAFVIITEAGRRSVQTAETIDKLAVELGIEHRFLVVNKVRGEEEAEMIKTALPGLKYLGAVSENEMIRKADLEGEPCFDEEFFRELRTLKERLEVMLSENKSEVEKSAI